VKAYRPISAPCLAALAVSICLCGTAKAQPDSVAHVLNVRQQPDGTDASAPPEKSSVPTAPAEIAPPASFADAPVLPIDLPTALRLVNASNPTIALARERVQEAYARLQQAQVLWLPNLDMGPAYQRHDGRIQNSHGDVFSISKSNFFIGGGAVMRFETVDALFAPLIARRLVQAQTAASQAVTDTVQLDVALTYLDLLRVYGALAINADILARAKDILSKAAAADRQEVSRSKADVTRARTEVRLREAERIDLEGQAAAVSARLAQLLLLDPATDLRPADPAIVPISLVAADTPLETLVATGLLNRPELAESRAFVAAALARWRRARVGPLLPRLEISYLAGDFGGGINDDVSKFSGRGDGTVQAVWTLHNLGAGDAAEARARQSQYNQANYRVLEVQAQVAAEVTRAAKIVRSRARALDTAQEAVQQALETFRRLQAAAYGILTKEALLDTLEPLIAEQTLAQARSLYLTQVIEYNKAQFQLYAALGQPPSDALAHAAAVPVEVPVAPLPYAPPVPSPAAKP
jgi:outer membrane protein TolC